jgi:hypothetical protein
MARQVRQSTFEIADDGELVGMIGVTAGGIRWSGKGEPAWYVITHKQLADFAKANGKKEPKPGSPPAGKT